ncbi:MAG: hypothetical protein E7425_10320 [Ruminococcaceae bacterium]|nr:hypothetical protein [Oscillospiraceae bacterium]
MRKHRRIVAAWGLVLCMVLSLVSTAFAANDIEGHEAQAALEWFCGKGYLNGYEDGSFQPDRVITRAEFAALVNRVTGYSEKSAEIASCTDVPADAWYYDDMAIALQVGYLKSEGGKMEPNGSATASLCVSTLALLTGGARTEAADAPITRAQAISALYENLSQIEDIGRKSAGVDYESQYLDLSGAWHFKVYRKYSAMFQYPQYGYPCDVTWEDAKTALVPGADDFSGWETVAMPADDYLTGGLLSQKRVGFTEEADDRATLTEGDLFPVWSEAWFCRTLTVPAGFLTESSVTLLLSVIDDVDVVYVNGTPVAASGFKTSAGERAPASNVPADGGIVESGEFRFDKSYWEVPREYTVPASLFREGENELCIRLYNNNSNGGMYSGTCALAATKACVNYLKGLPIDGLSDSAAYAATVAAQKVALESEDLDAYAATLAGSYNENELDKNEQLAKVRAMFDAYDSITVEDENGGYFTYNGRPVYFASRTVSGSKDGERAVISSTPEMIQYFAPDSALEQGNLSRCFKVKYVSALEAMGGKVLEYNIYLPPSYYRDTARSYPVVYLLHGYNSTGDSFVNVDHIAQNMDQWIASGEIAEMIVVMPNSGKTAWYRDTEAPNGVSDANGPWESHLTSDIIREIDGNYRTLAKPEFRAVTGISMGGAGVITAGVTHTDVFTSFACHMGAVNNVENVESYFDFTAEELAKLDFYLDCGRDDRTVDPAATQALGEYLESIGARVTWELRPGSHGSAFYMAGMPNSMKMHSQHFLANGLQ